MDGFNIYSDLVNQNIQDQNEAINKVQLELLEKSNSLQSRAEKAVEEIGSGVLLKEGLGRAITYVGSRIGGTAGKVVSDAASDYAEGGVPKVIEGLTTKGVQAAKTIATKAISKVGQELGEEGEDNVIQMEPLGELQTPIEGSANPTFVGEDADVVDELSGFGEQTAEETTADTVIPQIQAPTASAIQSAADVEDGLIPQEEEISTQAFDANVPFPEVEPGYDAYIASQASNIAEDTSENIAAAASQVAEDTIASGTTALENVASTASSAIAAGSSAVEDAGIAAASALDSAATTAASAVSSTVSSAVSAGTTAAASALETTGAALDASGVGAIVGIALGVGGILASIFAPGMDSQPDLPPLPNFSYQIGA